MIKVSHEVPLCLLEDSLEFNDYQYCLPHLIDEYPQYKEHFMNYARNGGFVIMDNGLFEGVNHTEQDLIQKINLIKPDVFVVPDAWNDMITTYRNAKYWMETIKHFLPKNTELMAVLQFKDYGEAMSLYSRLCDLGYKYIAFNHSSVGYQTLFPHKNTLVSQMMGRILLINKLLESNVIWETKHHHLLGCSLPEEFQYYQGYDFIKTLDTSHPIILSYEKLCYTERDSYIKSSTKIIDVMEEPYGEFSMWVNANVDLFKKYVNGKNSFRSSH
jgi:hypothetical protein